MSDLRNAYLKGVVDKTMEIGLAEADVPERLVELQEAGYRAVAAHALRKAADGWKPAKWADLKADDEKTGAPEGDTIRLTWEDGTVVIGRLSVPSYGSGHHQVCRMRTVFGGDTYVFPHGSTLEVRVSETEKEES